MKAQDSIRFRVKTSDETSKTETGRTEDEGTPEESLEVHGNYSYIGPDGKKYTVFYTAGKNGFIPRGRHLVKSASVIVVNRIPSAALASLAGK